MKALDKFTNLKAFDTDARTRHYLRPVRILRTEGTILNADDLLMDKDGQVHLDKPRCTVMKNEGGAHASVLLDFGREIHGSARILIQSCAPKRVKLGLRFGESVSEAITPTPEKGSTNDHTGRDYEIVVSSMGYFDTSETGYRFLNVELLEENALINLKAIEGVLIIRDVDYIGSFESSDSLLNEIYNTAAYTAHLNMQEFMWDGIKRDRLVWIGDMHPEVMTICSVFGENEVVPRSLDSARDITPIGQWMTFPSYSMWWIMCHYDYYRQNGNLSYLREQHEYLRALVPELCKFIGEDGREDSPNQFLDWPTRADPAATHAGIQGLYGMAMDAAAYLFEALGDADSAAFCRKNRALLEKHVPETNRKQSAALLSLSGIADADAIDRDVISVKGGYGYSTFFSYYILAARAKAGHTAEALDDLRQYYGAMLRLGATTFWEDFNLEWIDEAGGWDGIAPINDFVPEGKRDIHGDYGAYCYTGLRHSLCHGWSSGPVTFLTRHILGIKILEAGCKKLEIKPNLCGLEYVKGTYPTPLGIVSIYADKDGVKIDAPDGIEIVR